MNVIKKWRKTISWLLIFALLIGNFSLVSNADKYVAHIYVNQQSDTIHYSNPNKEVGTYSTVTIHYNRENQDYDNWDIW